MQTPWGPLANLDLNDLKLCQTILASDKHQLAEGLVVERVFDQIFETVPSHLPEANILDIETAVVRPENGEQKLHAFVWARKRQPGLGRYLRALSRRFTVWLVETDDPLTTFLARPHNGNEFCGPSRTLSDVARHISGRTPRGLTVSSDVRDDIRQQQSFWGFLTDQYRGETGNRVILPRLFMNCGLQPWFRAVWNLDRILVNGDDIWLLEIKHKYPMKGARLSFGINAGELDVIAQLGESGIRCLHAIVVKPVWSKDMGSMYVFNDLLLRGRAALIAVDLKAEVIAGMRAGKRATSASHTTFSGSGALNYYRLNASLFSQIGMIAAPAHVLGENIAHLVGGKRGTMVTDQYLRGLQSER